MGILTTLIDKLKQGEVSFEYKTSDMRIRKARGTLNQNLIPRDEWAKGASMKKPIPKTDEMSARFKGYQPYYDLDIGEWRRFKPLSLIRIISSNIRQKPRTNFDDAEFDSF